MQNDKLIDKQRDSQKMTNAKSDRQTKTITSVEMGKVSETKGFLRGLEIGFTPRG